MEKLFISKKTKVAIYHLFLSLVLFLPYFILGKYPLWSTDNLLASIPNLIFVKESLLNREIPLWNPYILGGIDYAASSLNKYSSPVNWPLLLLPEKFLLHGLVFKNIIELWLIGVFGFLFFKEELTDDKWAVFSSTVLQVGGLTLWALTNFHLPVILFTTISLYLMYTADKRRKFCTFVYYSLTLTVLLLSSSIPYAIAGLLTVIIFHFYRFGTSYFKGFLKSSKGIFWLSILIAFALSSFRYLPFMNTFYSSNRTETVSHPMVNSGEDRTLYAPRMFVPELYGINYRTSQKLIHRIAPEKKNIRHTHNIDFDYMGMIPILLCLWMLVNMPSKRSAVLSLLAIFFGAWSLKIKPLSDFSFVLFYPAIHGAVPRIVLFFLLCTLAGLAGKTLEDQKEASRNDLLKGFGIVVVTLFFCLLILAYQVDTSLMFTKFSMMFFVLALLAQQSFWPDKRFHLRLNILFIAMVFVFLPVLLQENFYSSLVGQIQYNNLAFLGMITALGCILVIYIFEKIVQNLMNQEKLSVPLRSTAAGCVLLLLIFWNLPREYPWEINSQALQALSVLGILKYYLVIRIFFALLTGTLPKANLRSYFFPFVLCLTLFDLICFQHLHRHLITTPFVDVSYLSTYKKMPPVFTLEGYDTKESFDSPKLNWEWTTSKGTHRNQMLRLSIVPSDPQGGFALKVRNKSNKRAYLFSSYQKLWKSGEHDLYYGAYVKTGKKNFARLVLGEGERETYSSYHSGSGEWEWLSVQYPPGNTNQPLNFRVLFEGKGLAYIDDVIITDKWQPLATIDFKNYRVNRPSVFLKIHEFEKGDNILQNIGLRSYGGINAMIPLDLFNFVNNFHNTAAPLKHRYGFFLPVFDNDRFLDLMGCKYDVSDSDIPVVRSGALSRFMLFDDYEVLANRRDVLKRLKDESFNPLETVILEESPTYDFSDNASKAISITPQKATNNTIILNVHTKSPSLIFFNDSYHPDWTATVNGQSAEVLRANYLFMAVPVPAGEHRVVLQFYPRLFFTGIWISSFMLFFVALLIIRDFRKPR